jgi:lysophospholipase L1-like esterase
MERRKLLCKRITIALCIPALFFGLIELGLRVWKIEVNTGQGPLEKENFFNFKLVSAEKELVDRDLHIETGPKLYPPDSGAYRYRDKNFEKQPREYRILTLGDSSTYGLGVKNPYPYYLERALNSYETNFTFKVFNFGYPGYSSFQGMLFLKRYIAELKPDFVIAWFGANDECFAPFYTDREFYYQRDKILKLVKIHNFLYSHLRLYRILRNINLNYFRKLVTRSFNAPEQQSRPFRRRVSPSEFRENLEEIKRISRSNNSQVLFIWHNWLIDGKMQAYSEYEPISPYIDLREIYLKGEKAEEDYYLDHCHPNELGHQLIGKVLAEKIIQAITFSDRRQQTEDLGIRL